jgi:hypothetical protein
MTTSYLLLRMESPRMRHLKGDSSRTRGLPSIQRKALESERSSKSKKVKTTASKKSKGDRAASPSLSEEESDSVISPTGSPTILLDPINIFQNQMSSEATRSAGESVSVGGYYLPPWELRSSGSCQLNENGFYGEPMGTAFEVSYAYQVVVRDGTTETLLQEQVAPSLDFSIAEALLPYFFPDCVRRRDLGRKLQTTTTDPTVMGVSRLNSDIPVSGGK